MLLAIDSGADAGWALFYLPVGDPLLPHNVLHSCGLRNPPKAFPRPVTRIVIEKPHTGKTRARAKDIITLAVRAGEAGGLMKKVTGVTPEYIEPNRWKGQLPKKRCNEIVEGKMLPEEMEILNKIKKKATRHNILDAIGIGLWAIGR